MKQTLYCQTVVSISESLPTAAVDIHEFSAHSLHSSNASKIACACYNLEKINIFTYLRFEPKVFVVK